MSTSLPVRLNDDRTVSVLMNKVEIGQGIHTSIAQIAAEELDVSLDRVRVMAADTRADFEGASTTGSNSIQGLGRAVRQAAADIRHHKIQLAAARFGVDAESLTIEDGSIQSADGRVVDYWELPSAAGNDVVSGRGRPKAPEAYRVVGQSVPRSDLPAKVSKGGNYVQDMLPRGGLHGRVVRPPSYEARLLRFEKSAVDETQVRIVQDGSFLGVLAEDEECAVTAAALLFDNSEWDEETRFPDQDRLYDHLLSQADQAFLVVHGRPTDDPVPPIEPPEDAEYTVSATYKRPYQMHGALGPSAAMALWEAESLTVWSHSQGVFSLRGALARVLDVPEEDIRVLHAEGSGCYGHNGADDAALDAALLARVVPGKHVLLKWSREDEHAWEPYGSCAVLKMQGSLDSDGSIVDWNHDVWSYTHSSRPRAGGETSSLLAARYLANAVPTPVPGPGKGSHSGIHRNADPLYAFPRRRVVKHFVPNSPLRVSALRGLGSFANVYAIESFMDELASAVGADPVAFRLRHLDDYRAKAVIEAAATAAEWGHPSPEGRGQGIGFARYKNEKAYVAVVADVSVDTDSGVIHLDRMTIVGDVGQVVNPDGVKSQLEGGVIQAASWTLKEEVTFSANRITSVDWETYPILRFDEVPDVETILIDRPGLPSLGCGEATQGPMPAAIANAVYVASGIRLRQIPFRPGRVRKALSERML